MQSYFSCKRRALYRDASLKDGQAARLRRERMSSSRPPAFAREVASVEEASMLRSLSRDERPSNGPETVLPSSVEAANDNAMQIAQKDDQKMQKTDAL